MPDAVLSVPVERAFFGRPANVAWYLARAVALVGFGAHLFGPATGAGVVWFVAFAVAHTVVARRMARAGRAAGRWGPLGVPARVRSALGAVADVPLAVAPFVVASAVWLAAEWVLIGWVAGVLLLGLPVGGLP